MGYGSYSHQAHQAMTTERKGVSAEAVFRQRECHPLMNPHGVKLRESRDSAEHPESLAIVFALDVSGSMGAIPRQLAQEELPNFMKVVTDCGVKSPQVMFMAFQDIASSATPVQAGQFETTAELMDQWLTWCWLQGGGGSAYESYDLALYFAAHHTAMDCWEKRQRKGYLFMTGDEPCYPKLEAASIERFLGEEGASDHTLDEVIVQVRETFHPFFLIPDPQRAASVQGFWREHIGGSAIALASPADTCAVSGGLLALGEGVVEDLDALAKAYEAQGFDKARVAGFAKAIEPWAKAR